MNLFIFSELSTEMPLHHKTMFRDLPLYPTSLAPEDHITLPDGSTPGAGVCRVRTLALYRTGQVVALPVTTEVSLTHLFRLDGPVAVRKTARRLHSDLNSEVADRAVPRSHFPQSEHW